MLQIVVSLTDDSRGCQLLSYYFYIAGHWRKKMEEKVLRKYFVQQCAKFFLQCVHNKSVWMAQASLPLPLSLLSLSLSRTLFSFYPRTKESQFLEETWEESTPTYLFIYLFITFYLFKLKTVNNSDSWRLNSAVLNPDCRWQNVPESFSLKNTNKSFFRPQKKWKLRRKKNGSVQHFVTGLKQTTRRRDLNALR
jgi:hypothetical protein